LVVDDEESLRHMLSLALSKDGFFVWTAGSGKEALDTLKGSEPFDICVTDVRMPGMDGLALIQDATSRLGDRAPTFIAMSAYGDRQLAIEALRRGAFDYISKPFEPAELALKLRLVVERNRLSEAEEPVSSGSERPKRDSIAPRGSRSSGPVRLDEFVISSPEMQAVARTVRKVASFPTTVLITGETGTGKERIAGAIHVEGRRAAKPFVAVNCGAIPESLLESELFGHVKGAFTDASGDRAGLFETANGGTLFLDEIAELPVQLQVKLLRVLVEGEIRRLGATRTVPVDVRLIAATSVDLERQIREGHFRDDLFHRLNVVSIHVPPLRERRGDIRPLVAHFSRRFQARLGIERLEVSEDALAVLERYGWPGNVRELENSLERAFVLSEGGGKIAKEDLDERFFQSPGSSGSFEAPLPRTASSVSGPVDPGKFPELNLRARLNAVEREVILQALEQTGGNRSRAAELLRISHRALLYKLKEHGIT
jgi:two-component system response regulator AtoC